MTTLTDEMLKKAVDKIKQLPPYLKKISMNDETYEFLKNHLQIYNDKADTFEWIKSKSYGSLPYCSCGVNLKIDNELPYGIIRKICSDSKEELKGLIGGSE